MDWFLYDNSLRHDRVKELLNSNSTLNTEEIPAAEYDLNINTYDFIFEEISKSVNLLTLSCIML